jgi:hypothetical protein
LDFSHVIGVYNLDGCVRQGFLARLKNLNWNESVTISAESVQGASKLRVRIHRVLWIVSNRPYFVAVILVALAWTIVWWKKRRLRRNPKDHAIVRQQLELLAPAHIEKYKSPPFCSEDVEAFRVSIGIHSFRPEGIGPVPCELSANVTLGLLPACLDSRLTIACAESLS